MMASQASKHSGILQAKGMLKQGERNFAANQLHMSNLDGLQRLEKSNQSMKEIKTS